MKIRVIRAIIHTVVVDTELEDQDIVNLYDSPFEYAKNTVEGLQFESEAQTENPFLSWKSSETMTAREIK